jgi:hypothetical protein
VRRNGELTGVDTRTSNAYVNPLGQTWSAGDLLFATTGGGLTNVRPTSGRSVKAAYTIKGNSASDILLVYPMENPIWVTAASAEDVVLRLGDNAGINKVSIRNYSNNEVASINSIGQLISNNTFANNSYQTISNQSIYDLAVNESWKDNLTAVNTSMKNYVDSGHVPITFRADNNSVAQSGISSGAGATKLKFTRSVVDTGGYYSTTNSRFTPLVAGYYYVRAQTMSQLVSSDKYMQIMIYKNGASNSVYTIVGTGGNEWPSVGVSAIVYMNGSTDYMEAYIQTDDGTSRTLYTAPTHAFFEGYKL